jgi:hypothetical protein
MGGGRSSTASAGERRQLPADGRLVAHGGMGIFSTGGTECNQWEKQHRE